MPRQRTACFTCASIKTACNRGNPCRRCQRLSLTCSYAIKFQRAPTTQRVRGEPSRRVRHSRSSQGCVNCLLRRKKCDEEFPICDECSRLGLAGCRPREPLLSDLEGPSHDFLQEETEYGIIENSTDDSRQFEHLNVNDYLVQIARMPEGNLAGLTRRDHLNESNALKSQQKNQGEEGITQTSRFISTPLPETIAIYSERLTDFDPTERYLLLHYAQYVSRALVVVDDDAENPYLTEILPMALDSKSVRHAMFALTACHLCKLYPMFEDTLERQHSLALHHLKLDLKSGDRVSYALTTSLLLCLFGICQGNSPKWILHLYGAKALIDLYRNGTISIAPFSFLIDLYESICCKTRITCDKVPATFYHSPSMTSTSQHGSSSPVHPLFGFAGSLYDMLDLVNQLPSECLQRSDSQINIKSQQLEKALQEWCVVPDQAIHHANIRLIREATMAAEAIRWAVLIRLYQIISHHQNQSDFYQDQKHAAVQNILNCISNISPSSPANSQLLLPLFMAGLCATRKTERLQIEYRLTLVESTVALGNISSVHQLLDMFWKRSHNGEEVDWEELLRTEYPYALLF